MGTDLDAAQADMRFGYYSGAPGILASAGAWLGSRRCLAGLPKASGVGALCRWRPNSPGQRLARQDARPPRETSIWQSVGAAGIGYDALADI